MVNDIRIQMYFMLKALGACGAAVIVFAPLDEIYDESTNDLFELLNTKGSRITAKAFNTLLYLHYVVQRGGLEGEAQWLEKRIEVLFFELIEYHFMRKSTPTQKAQFRQLDAQRAYFEIGYTSYPKRVIPY